MNASYFIFQRLIVESSLQTKEFSLFYMILTTQPWPLCAYCNHEFDIGPRSLTWLLLILNQRCTVLCLQGLITGYVTHRVGALWPWSFTCCHIPYYEFWPKDSKAGLYSKSFHRKINGYFQPSLFFLHCTLWVNNFWAICYFFYWNIANVHCLNWWQGRGGGAISRFSSFIYDCTSHSDDIIHLWTQAEVCLWVCLQQYSNTRILPRRESVVVCVHLDECIVECPLTMSLRLVGVQLRSKGHIPQFLSCWYTAGSIIKGRRMSGWQRGHFSQPCFLWALGESWTAYFLFPVWISHLHGKIFLVCLDFHCVDNIKGSGMGCGKRECALWLSACFDVCMTALVSGWCRRVHPLSDS